jgi:hypothetical protein
MEFYKNMKPINSQQSLSSWTLPKEMPECRYGGQKMMHATENVLIYFRIL